MSVTWLSAASLVLEELKRFPMLRRAWATPRHNRRAAFVLTVVIQSTRHPCGVP